jgi:CDP-diacylglycerol--glycerol-3-phosphate 3-phosphatidyltransferase
LFAILPIWLVARTACATLDGTLAIEFGQKSRLGGILNEAGDIVAEIAVFLPLAFVSPFSITAILFLSSLAVTSELAGIAGLTLGSGRRVEGPLGKADRSIVLSIIAVAIAILGRLPDSASIITPALAAGSVITIWNRLRSAVVEPRMERLADHHTRLAVTIPTTAPRLIRSPIVILPEPFQGGRPSEQRE